MSIGAAGRGALGLGAPANNVEIIINVPSKAFTFTSFNPVIIHSNLISPPSKAFTLTAFPPTITVGSIINVPSKPFTFTSFAPPIIGSNIIPIPSKAFSFTAFPPTIIQGSIISVPSNGFTFTPFAPDIIFKSKLLERTVNVACTKEAFIILIKIEHASLATPILVSNDPTQLLPTAQVRGTLSNGLEYIYFPFDFIFPNQEDNTSPIARLQIDNISREIATSIETLTSSPTFNIQIVLSSTPDIVELELFDFSLKSVQWNVSQLIGDITVESFDKEPFPSGRFNPSSFPGLFNN